MRSLEELASVPDPVWPLVREWIAGATNPVEVLPPDPAGRGEALLAVQVTLRSVLGAVVYETGGIRVDDGWIRLLGSGHPRLTRSVASWNAGRTLPEPGRVPAFVLVGDDVLGGFFALNGGAFDAEPGHVCYLAPDTLAWESLGRGYSDFVYWLLNGDLEKFYEADRWPGWRSEVRELSGDMAYSMYPFRSTGGMPIHERSRKPVPVEELYRLHVDANA